MATASLLHTFNTTENLSEYGTTSFTPTAGDYLVAFVTISDAAITGLHTNASLLAWDLVELVNTDAAQSLACFVCPSKASGSTISLTAFAAGSGTGADFHVYRVTGVGPDGLAAIHLSEGSSGSSGGAPAVTWPEASYVTDVLLGAACQGINPATIAPPSLWTEGADDGYATPSRGLESTYRNTGSTTTTVGWPTTTSTDWGAIAIAIDSRITGTATSTLGPVAQSATGAETIQGAAASTLGDAVQDASGAGEIAGAAASALDSVTHTATGAEEFAGAMTSTLGDVVQVAIGHARVRHYCCPNTDPIRHCGQRNQIERMAKPCVKTNQDDRTLPRLWRRKVPRWP